VVILPSDLILYFVLIRMLNKNKIIIKGDIENEKTKK